MARSKTTSVVSGGKVGRGLSAYDQANQAAFEREKEIRGLLDQIIGTYAPGGSYLQGAEAMLNRQKQQYLGSATQNLISSGLFGSTLTAGLPKKFEEEIGIPTRLKLEDMRTQAYTGALGQKADFINSIQENVPSYETLANLTTQSQRPSQSLSSWLAENFGGSPSSKITAPKTTSTVPTYNPTAAEEERKRRAAEAASVKIGTPIYGDVSKYIGA